MDRHGGYDRQAPLAELYDHVPGYVDRPDLDFYVGLAREAQGPTLELGCGTGRVLIPTAAAGCRVVGLDLSEHMLARCREKLGGQPAEVQTRARLVLGDMASFELGERFALVTTPFRPFQHLLSVQEQTGCLRCVHRHLLPGGRLVLDVFHPKLAALHHPAYLEEAEDFASVRLPDGRLLRRTHRVVAFHRAEQINDVEMVYHVVYPDGKAERLVQAFPFRYLFRYEVEHLLARCGFRVVELFGSFDRSPFDDGSPEMIFIAEKAEDAP